MVSYSFDRTMETDFYIFFFCFLAEPREPSSFNPRNIISVGPEPHKKCLSVREMFGKNESVYIMDAKNIGNIGRFLNVSIYFQ